MGKPCAGPLSFKAATYSAVFTPSPLRTGEGRHTRMRGVQLDAEIRDGVGQCRCALDRGLVDAVLDQHRDERRALKDRPADDPVLPGDQIARAVEPGLDRVEIHRAVAAAANVVLACPDQ